YAARGGVRGAVRGDARRHAAGEEPGRRRARRLQAGDGEVGPAGRGVPRERAHAPRRARRLTMKRLAAAAALALLAACGGTSGPQPAELTPIESPKPLRVLWSAALTEHDRYGDDWPPPPPSVSADR